ncbi:MAG: aldo/keto reductase [Betaproteobacteria bacterium HGW-Betaproteobacteria-5]|jgi:aldehyde reductase|nr:MAG: aldo/keto reductase [Betaproteobacteria bacterium HGW-Betaproteobacteria-5]PKO40479.1 MAG: aldo/keto reductase [Betaproteobacteria bacterium HGW-Betaproteobacteria-6]
MKFVYLPSGERVPALGMGTWMMGENPGNRNEEIATLQHGVDLGVALIDTAEMYGEGASEQLVGEAIKGRRDRVFLVSKVYPHNASANGMLAACERSLKRLTIECLDLYLLHWPGAVPLTETVETFEKLREQGKIRHWGVSNFDSADMQELISTTDGSNVAVNQVLYNLSRRGIEWNLCPWSNKHRIPLMAYSPVEQARLLKHRQLVALAKSLNLTPARLALAWLLHRDQLIVIPKASKREHLEENFETLQYSLDGSTLAELDRIFPPPNRSVPLEML